MPRIQSGLTVKVNPKVGMGLTTIAGLSLALAQYLGALATILSGNMTEESIGLIATATATFVTVAIGRYGQARDVIKGAVVPPSETTAVATVDGPEPNVLYLDGNALAKEVVRSLNTQALLAAMRDQTEPAPATGGE